MNRQDRQNQHQEYHYNFEYTLHDGPLIVYRDGAPRSVRDIWRESLITLHILYYHFAGRSDIIPENAVKITSLYQLDNKFLIIVARVSACHRGTDTDGSHWRRYVRTGLAAVKPRPHAHEVRIVWPSAANRSRSLAVALPALTLLISP